MKLDTIFTEEVISEFKQEIKKLQGKNATKGVFNNSVISAYEDILKSIEDGGIKDVEELDEYIEEHYCDSPDYFIIVMIMNFAEEEFESVSELFKAGKNIPKSMDSLADDIFDEEDEEEFEGRY